MVPSRVKVYMFLQSLRILIALVLSEETKVGMITMGMWYKLMVRIIEIYGQIVQNHHPAFFGLHLYISVNFWPPKKFGFFCSFNLLNIIQWHQIFLLWVESNQLLLEKRRFHKGVFTIYVYNARWVGGQKSGKFVNVYNIEIVTKGRWVVKKK